MERFLKRGRYTLTLPLRRLEGVGLETSLSFVFESSLSSSGSVRFNFILCTVNSYFFVNAMQDLFEPFHR